MAETDSELRYESGNIVVKGKNGNVSVPLEQTRELVLTSQKISISVQLINLLQKNNKSVVICDEKYNPSCNVVGYGSHSNLSGNIIDQSLWQNSVKNAVWQETVKSKIAMQISLLKQKNIAVNPKLEEYRNSVLPGDSNNREGQAARLYFKALFGKNFIRHSDDSINAALNYSYTIILSAFNRLVVSYGYHTALGIKHCSKSNPFNLSCDLMEPFRPFADKTVFENSHRELDWSYKKALIEILQTDARYNGRHYTLSDAMECYAIDVFKALKNPKHIIGAVEFHE